MKSLKYHVYISDEAEADVDNAFIWYEIQKQDLGLQFIRAVNAGISKIRKTPHLYPKVIRNVRKHLINKFPFCIYYFLDDDNSTIKIFAVFHNSRNPKNWYKRI